MTSKARSATRQIPLKFNDFAVSRTTEKSSSLSSSGRQSRLWIVAAGATVWMCLIVGRLYSLQLSDGNFWQTYATKQHSTEVTLAAERGSILDRNGKLLAVSVPASSLYVRPKQVKDAPATVKLLSETLNISTAEIQERLDKNSPFVWLARQLPRKQAQAVLDLKLPGIGAVAEARRLYPYNQAGSQVIGRVGLDGNGLSGLERTHERALAGEHIQNKMTRDAFGNVIAIAAEKRTQFELPRGESLELTLDADIQMIVDEELERGRLAAQAARAMAVMIDADTGEILALSQAPALNFNSDKVISKDDLKNISSEVVFEPGSILKPIIAAAAFDAGVVRPHELVDCENGRFRYSSHVIKDVHPSKVISFHDVVVRSSNIGMTKIGTRMGAERLHSALRNFGFGSFSGAALPGESRGILRSVDGWAKVDVATHSFGQGIAVTALQMTRAVAAIANGGVLPPLSILKGTELEPARRVVSRRAAELARDTMYGVVEDDHGTGRKAEILGVRIGGKTGTAQKARKDGKGYAEGKYIASFVGFADAREIGINRRIVITVSIDEPGGKVIYGGALAAPIFQKVMTRTLSLLTTSRQINQSEVRETLPHPSIKLARM